MSEIRLIEIKEEILTDNKEEADKLRKKLKDRGIFLLNHVLPRCGENEPHPQNYRATEN